MSTRSTYASHLEKRAQRNWLGRKLAETKHIGKLQAAWLAATFAVTPLTALGIMAIADEPEIKTQETTRAVTPANQQATAAYLQKLDIIDQHVKSGQKLEKQIGDVKTFGNWNRMTEFSEYAQANARAADATVLGQALLDTRLTPAQFKTITAKASESFEVNARSSLGDMAATPKSETTLISCQNYVLNDKKNTAPDAQDAKRIANCMVQTTVGGSFETRAFISGLPLGMIGSFGFFLLGAHIFGRRERYLDDMNFVRWSDNLHGYRRPPELTNAEARANLDSWLKGDRARIKPSK